MGDPSILNNPRLLIKYDWDKAIPNPFLERFGKFDNKHFELIDIFDNNLTFAVYNLMKWKGQPLKLAPFQSVVLDTLWHKTFPIVLMTRGGGKCISGDSIIQTSSGFSTIDSICVKKIGVTPAKISMFGENGFNNTSFVWTNPPEKTYQIETQFGYTIKGVGKHKVRIIENGAIKWKQLKDFDGSEYVCISRDSSYEFSGEYSHLSCDIGYLFGALIGDGCFVQSKPTSIGFTNADSDVIENVRIACSSLGQVVFADRKDPIEFSLNFGSREDKLLFLDKYGFSEVKSNEKVIPDSILKSNKKVLSSFISGYFDTDGTVNDKGVSATSTSEVLIRQLQTVLLSYGIISSIRSRSMRGGNYIALTLDIRGEAAKLFRDRIGFRSTSKQAKLNRLLENRKFNSNRDLLRCSKGLLLQLNKELKEHGFKIGSDSRRLLAKSSIEKHDYTYAKISKILETYRDASHLDSYRKLKELRDKNIFFDSIINIEEGDPEKTYDVHIPNDHTFISNGFISHNTFMLAVYALLRALMTPGSKIVIVAASFRQSKLVFDYIKQIHDYSPLVQQAVSKIHQPNDQSLMIVGPGLSTIRALPLGNGEKIRGIRATDIITDEFASIPEEIFQVVVRGFAAVSADPIRAAEQLQMEEELIKKGLMREEDRKRIKGNKIVYAGTASFQFNHYYKLYQIHKAIIDSKFIGDARQINTEFDENDGDVTLEGHLDYRDYAIIQIPYTGLPKGFMDEKQINQAFATMPKALFQMEYECQFPSDSDGFFKRSAIDDATPGPDAGGFAIEMTGNPKFEYVMGIDPARKTDNFAISILKLIPGKGAKNVYCWTMNNKSFVTCVDKIRQLMNKFNIVRIAMDSGGGGYAVEDLLQNVETIKGAPPIWRYDDAEHARFDGVHILDMVNFNPTWIRDANYGLAADIEHKRLLFPHRDSRTASDDKEEDDVWGEINEQIIETCMICVSTTRTGVEHFDLPDLPTTEKATISVARRKDRYSALLLAGYAARTYVSEGQMTFEPMPGGWLDEF